MESCHVSHTGISPSQMLLFFLGFGLFYTTFKNFFNALKHCLFGSEWQDFVNTLMINLSALFWCFCFNQLYDSVVSVHEQNGTKEASDVLGHRNPASSRSTSPPSGVVVGSQTLVPSATIPGPIGTIAVTADSVINGAGDASTHTVGAHSSNVYTTLTTSGSADRVLPLSEDPCSTTTTALKSDDPLGRLKSNTLRFHTSSDSMNVGIYDPYYGVGKFQIFFLFACFSIGL